MSFNLAPEKENGHKPRCPILCNYCKKILKDQTTLSLHVRVNHADELAKSKRALSSDACPIVLGLPCQPIGRSARARIDGRTFFKKGSSSSNTSPVPPTESSPKNSGSIPPNHRELAATMPYMNQTLQPAAAIFNLCPLSSITVTTSQSNSEAAARNLGGVPHLAPAVVERHPGLPPLVPYKFKKSSRPMSPPFGPYRSIYPRQSDACDHPLSPPLDLRLSLGSDQFAAGLPPMKYRKHGKGKHGKESRRASKLRTSDMMGFLRNPKSNCSNYPSKPSGSSSAPKLDLALGGPGASEEEDLEELDLSLHL